MPGNLPPTLISNLIEEFPKTRRILIAFSGGLDSRVLLHLSNDALKDTEVELIALHVNHGLQKASEQWADFCSGICHRHGIPIRILKASLALKKGQSIEAEARQERYSLLRKELMPNDLLLLAQHADDQIETALLQMLRGAGPKGIAAMPRVKAFPPGTLVRPFLEISRDSLELWAKSRGLEWIDDPSNLDTRFDRNFLRHKILPSLKQRFPSLQKTLARSARNSAAMSDLLDDYINAELKRMVNPLDNSLSLSDLKQLPSNRIKHLLRAWISESGALTPQERQLRVLVEHIQRIGSERACSMDTSSYKIRQYRQALYLIDTLEPVQAFSYRWPGNQETAFIPELNSQLSRQALALMGIALPENTELHICNRRGGEKIRQGHPAKRRPLKKLFQEHAVPPWRRDYYPLIYRGESLIAIPGLAVDPDYTC